MFLAFALSLLASVDLGGSWQVTGEGLSGTAQLPGTLLDAGLGHPADKPVFGSLTPKCTYVGKATYARTVGLGADFVRDGRLSLERVRWRSRVWWDGEELSSETSDSLNAPHVYQVPKSLLTRGRHRVSIEVDNSMIHPIGMKGASYSDCAQAVWNGVLGGVRLSAASPLDDAQVMWRSDGSVSVMNVPGATAEVQDLKGRPEPWSIDRPKLYTVRLTLGEFVRDVRIGFRTLAAEGRRLTVNGRPFFVRGALGESYFPLTGYPPTDRAYWDRTLGQLKREGVNLVRFHSWSPPEAAFAAADELGLFLAPEVIWIDGWMKRWLCADLEPFGKDPKVNAFVRAELLRILSAYGNHPSFFSLKIGNEIGGDGTDYEMMGAWMKELKARDPRRLYSASTANQISSGDDFIVTLRYPGVGMVRERHGEGTDWDYEDVYSQVKIPTVAHEVGLWATFPDWEREMALYTGLMLPRNLEAIRERSIRADVIDLSSRFQRASVKTNRLMYKDEIESFLRTPSCSGVELLDVRDFGGEGEAFIGWCDSCYNPKPGTEEVLPVSAYYRDVACLARFSKYVWRQDERCEVAFVVRNNGEGPVGGFRWRFGSQGGAFAREVPVGAVEEVGRAVLDFSSVRAPARVELAFGENRWPIFVYPAATDASVPSNVTLTADWPTARAALAKGARVLFAAFGRDKPSAWLKGSFKPVYWSTSWFASQPCRTVGMCVEARSAAFAAFPTEDWQDWQWKRLVDGASVVRPLPPGATALAEPVVDFHEPSRAGLVWEARCGRGALLVCGCDIERDIPEARQLRRSLLDYAASAAFAPAGEVAEPVLESVLGVRPFSRADIPDDCRGAVAYVECAAELKGADICQSQANDLDRSALSRGSYKVGGRGCVAVREGGVNAWSTSEIGGAIAVEMKDVAAVRGRLRLRFRKPAGVADYGVRIQLEEKPPFDATVSSDGQWIEAPVDMEDFIDREFRFDVYSTSGAAARLDRVSLQPNGDIG